MDGRRVLIAVMDGVGARDGRFGNAVRLAWTPAMHWLKQYGLYTTLRAHGTAVGQPSDDDIGNSEVGHNALGAGRVFDQGAKLVNTAMASGRMFEGDTWKEILRAVNTHGGTLHFLGLLSDGNVHSHEAHLHQMLTRAKQGGVKRVRVHVLFDGRDVGEKSAEVYVERLEALMEQLRAADFDVAAASGGGRMWITMDRYGADWGMVERGWRVHVLGEGRPFPSLTADHGNCEEMFDVPQNGHDNWEALDVQLPPKTAHTLSPVPFYFYDPAGVTRYRLRQGTMFTLANIASTVIDLLDLEPCDLYQPSIIQRA